MLKENEMDLKASEGHIETSMEIMKKP